jgi:cytoskeleton protein RodZ
LADVSKETKIQPWVLEALEADRLHEQMSPIYVNGFVTNYAKFLHLEAEPLLAQLRAAQPSASAATPLPVVSGPIPVTLKISWTLVRRLALGAAASAAFAALIVLNPIRLVNAPLKQLMAKSSQAMASRPKAKVAQRPKTTRSANTAVAKAAAKHAPAPSAAPAPKLASLAQLSEPVTLPAPPAPAIVPVQPLELAIKAQRTTWIQVRADGKLLTQRRLPRGANEQWVAKKRFELIVANPSQVELTLNGQPISSFAIAHNGRLKITHAGVIPLPAEEP